MILRQANNVPHSQSPVLMRCQGHGNTWGVIAALNLRPDGEIVHSVACNPQVASVGTRHKHFGEAGINSPQREPQREIGESQRKRADTKPFEQHFSVPVVLCGGILPWANQARGAGARQSLSKNNRANLEQLFGRCGLKSRRSTSRSARASRNAGRNTLSMASASPTRARPTPSWARSSVETFERPAMLPIARTEPSCFCDVDGWQCSRNLVRKLTRTKFRRVVPGGAKIAVGDEPASCELKGSFASSGTINRRPA